MQVLADDNTTVLAGYTYGDSNERLIVEEGGLRTYYVWDGTCEYVESGGSTTPAWSKSYVYLGGRLLSTLTPNGGGGEAVQFHHPDRLGTRLVTDPANGTSFEQVTLPFGTALNAESTGTTNKRFTSYDRSATTGLDYANNRHYDSQQGRFTQVDPIGMSSVSLESPQTLNLYAYCANDPINNADPSGLGFFSSMAKIFKAIKKIIAIALVVVVVVAVVLAIVSTAGSAGAAFAHFLISQVAPRLLLMLGNGTMKTPASGPGGTPPIFGSGRVGFVSGFQGQGPASKCPPDCQDQISLPPADAGTIYANYSRLERALRKAGNFMTGVVDELNPLSAPARHAGYWITDRLLGWHMEMVDEDATSYKAGGWTAFAATIIVPGVGEEATLGHIFRNAVGHVNPATVASKVRYLRLFEEVASDPANLRSAYNLPGPALGAGVKVYTKIFRGGKQVWVYVRNSKIINAGVNAVGGHR